MIIKLPLSETIIDCYKVILSSDGITYNVKITDDNIYQSVYYNKAFTDKNKAIKAYKKAVSDLLETV